MVYLSDMKEPLESTDLKIVVIGGGTGSFTLLSALKSHSNSLTAIVNMVDDGGSTGVLRDELGVLPPGDVRQCLVALSNSPKLRDLFNYRFEEGTFEGHAFGNVFLSALEKVTGNFNEAVETASEILNVKGRVVPATLDDIRLKMEWPNASITLHGERVIDADHFQKDPRTATLSLVPVAKANSHAVEAIKEADIVVVAPGDLYTSLGPLLIIDEIGQALQETKAPVVYVANLVTKRGQTDGFAVSDHAAEIERFAKAPILDYVLFNSQEPDKELAEKYRESEGALVVEADVAKMESMHYEAIGGEFLGRVAEAHANDKLPVTRSLIRHNTLALADAIIELYEHIQSRSGK